MLADEQDAVVFVEHEDAGGEVLEMDDAVDPGLTIRAGHLVVPDGDPGVLVGDPARATDPGADGERHLVRHGCIVARGGRRALTTAESAG